MESKQVIKNMMEEMVYHSTREEAFRDVNDTQEYYVNKLIEGLDSTSANIMKKVYFTSATGTGKTKMTGLLSTKLPNYFFIVTTPSDGGLDKQTKKQLEPFENIQVFGVAELKCNSKKVTESKILETVSNKGKGRPVIWIRDEGHKKTNCWYETMERVSHRIIDVSATNEIDGNSGAVNIKTNFTHTVMLRTPVQSMGTPEDAIKKLLEVKKEHESVKNYNPCAIFRCTTKDFGEKYIEKLCKKYNLKYIDIIGDCEDNDIVAKLCEDTNEYDVIVFYRRITEGIDIGRAHVIYFQSTPKDMKTTIQCIGRCRRNALWNREVEQIGVDIYDEKNIELFNATKYCYVYYNKDDTSIEQDEEGNPILPQMSVISVKELKPNVEIYLNHGKLPINGLKIAEADNASGKFKVSVDAETGFNVLERITNKRYELSAYKKEYCEYQFYPFIDKKIMVSKYKPHPIKSKWLISGTEEGEMLLSEWFASSGKTIRRQVCEWNGNWNGRSCFEVNTDEGKIFLPAVENKDLPFYTYYPYTKVVNDRELTIIGIEDFKLVKSKNNGKTIFTPREITTLTSKISGNAKFSQFIENKYKKQIDSVKNQLFIGKNNFGFTDNRINKVLGYLVEFYAKYNLYGKVFLMPYTSIAMSNLKCGWDDNVAVYACFLKYVDEMKRAFGEATAKALIKGVNMKDLIIKNGLSFIQTVIQLGTKAAEFIKSNMDVKQLSFGDKLYDPNLSTKHITALCDFITHDTIIDIKVTNYITIKEVHQILGYYYLSTKRSDLDIHTLIIYDATSGNSVTINL